VGGIGEGWGARIAAKILEVGLVGGEGSRVASGEEEVNEPVALRHGRRLGNGFGERGWRGHGGTLCLKIIEYHKHWACRKFWVSRTRGENRPSFQALLACGKPKQNASSRFCSHTVRAADNRAEKRPVLKQPVGGIGEGWGTRVAAKILEVGLIGGEGSRAASGEEEVNEPKAHRHGRQHGYGLGEGAGTEEPNV
jgi:hypothetical protein